MAARERRVVTMRLATFRSIVDQLTSPLNIIVSSVDFDAVGSAMALSHIVQQFGRNPRIYYCGPFAMRQADWLQARFYLRQWLRPISELRVDEEAARSTALVDSANVADPRLGPLANRLDPLIVIDNHQGVNLPGGRMKYAYIDKGVCAVSTLLWELMAKLGVSLRTLTSSDQQMLRLMLAMGIYTDARGRFDGWRRDLAAYQDLQDGVSQADLDKLINFPLPDRFEEYQRHAEAHVERDSDWLITSVGRIEPEDIHLVSEVADRISLDHPGVFVIVFGVYGDDHGTEVKVSVRQQNCDDLEAFNERLQRTFDPGAGGRIRGQREAIGGAFVSLPGCDRLIQPDKTFLRRTTLRVKALKLNEQN